MSCRVYLQLALVSMKCLNSWSRCVILFEHRLLLQIIQLQLHLLLVLLLQLPLQILTSLTSAIPSLASSTSSLTFSLNYLNFLFFHFTDFFLDFIDFYCFFHFFKSSSFLDFIKFYCFLDFFNTFFDFFYNFIKGCSTGVLNILWPNDHFVSITSLSTISSKPARIQKLSP